MLFHVTAKHDVDHCPAYDPALKKKLQETLSGLSERSEELGVHLRSYVQDGPGHEIFMVLEADALSAITAFLMSFPMRQDFDIRPVLSLDEMRDVLAKMGSGE